VEVRCGEGVAIHTGLKSCVSGRREAPHEALTEGCAGQLLSSESALPGRRRRYSQVEGEMRGCDSASAQAVLRDQRPWHARTLLAREPGDLWVDRREGGPHREDPCIRSR
jgi:hypothetical protein